MSMFPSISFRAIRHSLLRTLAIVVTCGCALAAKPDRWKGLVLSEATPQQVIAALGTPRRDQTANLEKLVRERLLNGSHLLRARKNDVVRGMKYENVDNFKSVSLLFKDDKLVLIQLVPDKQNKIAARDLKGLYEEVPIREVFEHHDFWTQAYGVDQATGAARPKTYPVIYYIIGIAEERRSVIMATIENQPGLASMLGGADITSPGRVMQLDLVAEALLPPKPRNKSLE